MGYDDGKMMDGFCRGANTDESAKALMLSNIKALVKAILRAIPLFEVSPTELWAHLQL